jgi:cyclophilin family peptidyl-prolyl cis-trans isomerase
VYLEDTYGDDIRTAYRHFPLSFHDKALITAEASEAAGAQGKFFEMHDLLYERQQDWNQLADDALEQRLIEYAEELGLDTERFTQELRDHVYLEKVEAQGQDAVTAQLAGTPSYIVNGVVYPTQELGLNPLQIVGFIELLQLGGKTYEEVPPPVVDPSRDYVATIQTNKGEIVVELFAEAAPANVNSFVFLSQEGWYDGQDFFYVDPDVAAYSGDPTGMGWGLPFPGYICGDEIQSGLTFDEPGMVALFAPAGGRNSSLFFITTAPQTDWVGRFTIIGQVTEGLDVVRNLTPTQPGGPTPDSIEQIRIDER